MDRFYGPSSSEYLAHSYLTDHGSSWDTDSTINESLESVLAGCVAYQALARYLKGDDLYILPRARSELDSIFRRYVADGLHNLVAKSRATLQPGGYSRVCHLADKSLRSVLNSNDNASVLLALHTPPSTPMHELENALRSIRTQ